MTKRATKQYSLGYFNLARGLGFLFVLAGHSLTLFYADPDSTAALPVFGGAGWIMGGGIMAMFFMISGFYFYRRTPWKCVKMQARLLLKPYFLTALAIIAATGVKYYLKGADFTRRCINLILTYGLGYNAVHGMRFFDFHVGTISIFWFVLALFTGWVLFNMICWIPGRGMKIACVCSFVLLSWDLSVISPVWPWSIHTGFLAVGYIAVGYMIRKYDLLNLRLPKWVWFLLGSISLFCMAFGFVDIVPGIWLLGPLDVLGSFCVGFLLMRTYSRLVDMGIGAKGLGILDLMGLNSIWFLCIHALEKALIPWEQLRIYFPDQPMLCSVICFTARISVILLCFCLAMGIRRLTRRCRLPKVVLTKE